MDDLFVNALIGFGKLTLIIFVSAALVGLGYLVEQAFTKK